VLGYVFFEKKIKAEREREEKKSLSLLFFPFEDLRIDGVFLFFFSSLKNNSNS